MKKKKEDKFICEICHEETPNMCEGCEPFTCADCCPFENSKFRDCAYEPFTDTESVRPYD